MRECHTRTTLCIFSKSLYYQICDRFRLGSLILYLLGSMNIFSISILDAPWCPHSRAMEKDFAQAAKKLANEGSPIKLAKIDSTKAPTLEDEYDIDLYPTLKFFKDGQATKYKGNL